MKKLLIGKIPHSHGNNLLPKQIRKKYDDVNPWNNLCFSLMTSKIGGESFRPLFEDANMGVPNASIHRLVVMNILKEGFWCGDEELFDKIQFDLLTLQTLGLEMSGDALPSTDTYYLICLRICDCERIHGIDLPLIKVDTSL